MVVYHVCSKKKLLKYLASGFIKAPVRAWITIDEAERFSKQTGRRIILRLKFPADAEVWTGHRCMARIIYDNYKLEDF